MGILDTASPRTIQFLCKSSTTAKEISKASSTSASIDESKKVERQRTIETSIVKVRLVEFIRDLDKAHEENDKHYGLFLWPSALLLCRFIASEAETLFRDNVVLELGCGVGLPSILASLCGAGKVYLTDRPDAADIKRNAEVNINVNNIQTGADFIPLEWGDMHVSDEVLSIFRTVDVVLAADCFYQSGVLQCRFRKGARYRGSDHPLQQFNRLQVLFYLPASQYQAVNSSSTCSLGVYCHVN